MERWRPEQIRFSLDDSGTDNDIWTITVHTPGCTIQVMSNEGEVSPDGRRLTLSHVHTEGALAHTVGVANLRLIGERFCEEMNL